MDNRMDNRMDNQKLQVTSHEVQLAKIEHDNIITISMTVVFVVLFICLTYFAVKELQKKG